MNNVSFKQAVLDALGVKFQPDQTKIGNLVDSFNLNAKNKNINKNEIFNLNKNSSDSTIRRNIMFSINKLLTIDPEDKDYANKEDRRKEYEESLKSFSLDDLLKNSKGFEIGKGIHISNDLGYKFRNLKADKKNNEKKLLSLTHKNLMPGKLDAYVCNGNLNENSLGINKNDYIFVVDKNLEFEKQGTSTKKETDPEEKEGGPSTAMEEAIRTLVGGKKNLTKTDPILDITSGIYISVKCYKEDTNSFDYGSLDGLNNFDFEKKHLKYELYNWKKVDITNPLFTPLITELQNNGQSSKGLKSKKIYVCKRNPKSGFVVKDSTGKLKLAPARSHEFISSKKEDDFEDMKAVNGFTWDKIKNKIKTEILGKNLEEKIQFQTGNNNYNIELKSKDNNNILLCIQDNYIIFKNNEGKKEFEKYIDNVQLKDLQGLGILSDFSKSKKLKRGISYLSYENKDTIFNYILAKFVRKINEFGNGTGLFKQPNSKTSVATYFNY